MVEPIASAFNVMAGRVQALVRSHSDLEQSVAHELRTPLAQLKFDLELARTSATAGGPRAPLTPRWSRTWSSWRSW